MLNFARPRKTKSAIVGEQSDPCDGHCSPGTGTLRSVKALEAAAELNLEAALPLLRDAVQDRGQAAIVNTCSVAAIAGLPQRAAYSASKGAVYSLTLAMAADHVAEGIRVNCVTPGTADTPWVGRLLDAAPDPAAERADTPECSIRRNGRAGWLSAGRAPWMRAPRARKRPRPPSRVKTRGWRSC